MDNFAREMMWDESGATGEASETTNRPMPQIASDERQAS